MKSRSCDGVWHVAQLPIELVQPNFRCAGAVAAPKPLHDVGWWAKRTKDFDSTDANKNDPAVHNRVLWEGTMGGKPYPAGRSGLDLRRDREALLQSAGIR